MIEREPRSALLPAGLWLAMLSAGCGDEHGSVPAADPERGKIHFENYCAACHQPEGPGMEGPGMEDGVPPLEGSPWVAGSETRLIRIVLHGVRGVMELGGRTYNLEMPGFGQVLTDAEIASLLSFVRWRHGGPSPPVPREAVSRVRALNPDRTDYWTVAELLEEP